MRAPRPVVRGENGLWALERVLQRSGFPLVAGADEAGRVLVTTRAAGKPSFPSVVTNSVCGHPLPGEPLADAVRRRAGSELGVDIEEPRLVLPDFRYRATSDSGLVEHELARLVPGPEADHQTVRERPWLRAPIPDVGDRDADLLAHLPHHAVLQHLARLDEPGEARH